MRLNQFVAKATGMSRRSADLAIKQGKVEIDGKTAKLGTQLANKSEVKLDGMIISLPETTTILLNKPVGYVCSRKGQGSKTIYDLLPSELHGLKPVGRLDKDSSGLLIMTNDGSLTQKLTHPSKQKNKVYHISLNKPLSPKDKQQIEQGVELGDGVSTLKLEGKQNNWTVTMHEGRNRQIRRTFNALGYIVTKLHRVRLDEYKISGIEAGKIKILTQ